MTVRVEVVTPCSHGEFEPHEYWPHGAGGGARPPDMPPLGPCDGGSRRMFTEWPPEAKKRGADALYRLRWGDHPPSQNAAIYAQCEKEAELAQAAGWETLTGDNSRLDRRHNNEGEQQ